MVRETFVSVSCLVSSTTMLLHARGILIPSDSGGSKPLDTLPAQGWFETLDGNSCDTNLKAGAFAQLSPDTG